MGTCAERCRACCWVGKCRAKIDAERCYLVHGHEPWTVYTATGIILPLEDHRLLHICRACQTKAVECNREYDCVKLPMAELTLRFQGEDWLVLVDNDISVVELKEQICLQTLTQFSPQGLSLICANRLMESGCLLSDYSAQHYITIYVNRTADPYN